MAGRSNTAQVNERRLKPIYDSLDSGNNKQAIQLVEKLLKKQKDLACARSLKGLALWRLGRQDESTVILNELVDEQPTDEATLQAMTICFGEMANYEMIAKIYETAVRRCPQVEEHHTHLFMAYVRIGDCKKQHQAAMALYKVFPKNPYYFWAVMSLVMQAHGSDDQNMSMKMLLPLAERMVEKFVNDGKVEADAELQLYLMVLNSLEKHEKALDIIQRPIGDLLKFDLNSRQWKTAALFYKLKKWPHVNRSYKVILSSEPDLWDAYQKYIESLLALVDAKWEPENSDADIDHTIQSAVDFICDKIRSELLKTARHCRGPFLAKMELMKQLKNRQEDFSIVGDLSDSLCEYFSLFGSKSCCFPDLVPYLCLMDRASIDDFHARIYQTLILEPDHNGLLVGTDLKQMLRHITYLRIERYQGKHIEMNTDQLIAFTADLIRRREDGLKYGLNLLKTELQYSDEYGLLAVNVLYDLWSRSNDDRYIWCMLSVLESTRRDSRSQHTVQLMLIRLFCYLGVFEPCPALYEAMEIKQIQQDTLGYCATSYVQSLGHYYSANCVYGATLKFFTVGTRESTEHVLSAYKFGSFQKIAEFVDFRNKLMHSLIYSKITIEKMLLDIMLETNSEHSLESIMKPMHINPSNDEVEWTKLSDNRDLDIISKQDPSCSESSHEDRAISYHQEVSWLRLRSFTLRGLAAAVQCVHENKTNGHQDMNGSCATNDRPESSRTGVLCDIILSCRSLMKELREDGKIQHKFRLFGPPRNLVTNLVHDGHIDVLFEMLDIISSISQSDQNVTGCEQFSTEIETKFSKVVPRLKGMLAALNCCENASVLNPRLLERLGLLVETGSLVIIISHMVSKQIEAFNVSLRGGKRKKKKTPSVQLGQSKNMQLSGPLAVFQTDLRQFTDDLVKTVTETPLVFTQYKMANIRLSQQHNDLINLDVKISEQLWKAVEESYVQSAKEMSELLLNKLTLLPPSVPS